MSSKRNERSEKASERLCEKEKEERKDRKEVIAQGERESGREGTWSNGTERWRGPVCMHLGARKGPRRERHCRCGRDEARPSNVVRSVVVWRTGASTSCSSSSPRVHRVSLLPKLPCFAWNDDFSFLKLNSEIFWCKLPKRRACFRLAFVHRTEISLSQRQTVSTVHSLFRKAYGSLRVSFFSRHAREIISEIFW